MALLCMLVFYVQVIAISQLVLALLMRTLQSRRFRDLSILIIAVFSSSCYIVQQIVFHALGGGNGGFLYGLQHLTVSPYLQWFPPGMAARAIQQAYVGNWGVSFVWLGALLVISIVVLYLWQMVVERALTADMSGGTVSTRRRRVRVEASRPISASRATNTRHLLPPQVTAIALKDVKYFRRDPQLQALLFQSLMSIVVLIVVTVLNIGNVHSRLAGVGSWVVLLVPAFTLLSLYTLSSNVFGMERQSVTTLFLFPVKPRYILWGKNLVVFVAGLVEVTLLVILASIVSHGWNYMLPALAVGLAGICVIMGCGNFTSVYFPMRIRQMRRGFQAGSNLSSEAGCLRAVMSLVALAVTAVVLIPVAIALVLPIYFHMLWFWTFSIPLSIIYGAAFYYVVTLLVSPRLMQRVPEILAVVARE